MNRILLTLVAVLSSLSLWAEPDGKAILDKAADNIAQAGNLCVEFQSVVYSNGKEQSKTKGKMFLQDIKFQLDTPDMMVWYDGKTQWALMPENREVNITEPTPEELMSIHPYAFLSIYKAGYNIKATEIKHKDQAAYEVHLVAQKKELAIEEAIALVRKTDCTLISVRARQGKVWQHISIETIQGGLKLSDADFQFNPDNYPNCEIIDLR